jgi:hypothetical protein
MERQNPGITLVERDEDGTIAIPDEEYDLETLIEEIDKEVKKNEGRLHGKPHL